MERDDLLRRAIRMAPSERRELLDGLGDPELRRWLESRLADVTHPRSVDHPTVPIERIGAEGEPYDPGATAIDRGGIGSVDGRFEIESRAEVPSGSLSPERSADAGAYRSIVGRRIGPYEILEPIGQGGMGSVFLAEQHQPVSRRVALKLIRSGMDTDQVIARFEAERQALALMDHPNIARVLDAGATDEGLPFFVMELVRGVPITKYCDERKLDLPSRLSLFRQVCQAVQHAHQKGIVHRDLKPSNILVSEADGVPIAKVIDFGLAKALERRLTERSLHTGLGQIVGTLEYMSPEQARSDDRDVDTRTDIYSLGVLLYELLTGSTPLRRETLRGAALSAILSRIRDEEPQRPSQRIAESRERSLSISTERRIDSRRLSGVMRRDLDWIVLKSLEKERERRYSTAAALSDDIARFLADEPIEARPPSANYRIRKFVRKHRLGVGFAATVLLLLIAGIVVSISLTRWALDERADAIEAEGEMRRAKDEAVTAKGEAETARDAAQSSERRTRKLLDLVIGAFRSSDPSEGAGYDMPASFVLRRAFEDLDRTLADDPVAQASLSDALGRSFLGLGDHRLAIDAATRAVERHRALSGEAARATLDAELLLFWARYRGGPNRECLELVTELSGRCAAALGADDRLTLAADQATAVALDAAGKDDAAYERLDRTYRRQLSLFGADDPHTLATTNNLAGAERGRGNHVRGLELYRSVLDVRIRIAGEEHPETMISANNLALALADAGETSEAIEAFRANLERRRRVLGPDHPDTLLSEHHLAQTLRGTGETTESQELWDHAIAAGTERLGPDHPVVLVASAGIAIADLRAGRFDAAAERFESIAELHRRRLGESHPTVLTTEQNLAIALMRLGEFDRAAALVDHVLEVRRRLWGDADRATLTAVNNLGAVMLAAGQLQGAEERFATALAGRRELLGDRDPETIGAANNLAGTRMRLGNPLGAIEPFRLLCDATASDPPTAEYLQHRRNFALALIESVKRELESGSVVADSPARAAEGVAILESGIHSWPPGPAAGLANEGRRFAIAASMQSGDVDAVGEGLDRLAERADDHASLRFVLTRLVAKHFPTEAPEQVRAALLDRLRAATDRLYRRGFGMPFDEEAAFEALAISEGVATLSYGWMDERRACELFDRMLLDFERVIALRQAADGKIESKDVPEVSSDGQAVERVDRLLDRLERIDWKSELTAEEGRLLAEFLNEIAWAHATAADPALHDGPRSVRMAKLAETHGEEAKLAGYLDTLAAAHARAGEFERAVEVQERALAANTDPELTTELTERLERYRAGEAFGYGD